MKNNYMKITMNHRYVLCREKSLILCLLLPHRREKIYIPVLTGNSIILGALITTQ